MAERAIPVSVNPGLLVLLLAFVFVTSACGTPRVPDRGGEEPDTLAVGVAYAPLFRLHGGIRYFVEAGVDHRPPHVLFVRLAAFAAGRHQTPSPDARPHPCDIEIRLHRGTAVAWWMGGTAGGTCLFADRWTENGGELLLLVPIRNVLGDSLPEGEYTMHTTLHVRGDTLGFEPRTHFLSMDSLPPIDDAATVEISGSLAHLSAEHVAVEVLLRNRGTRTVRLVHAAEGCAVRLELTSLTDPRRVWKEHSGCVDSQHQTFVRPGQLLRWPEGGHFVETRGVLGDSLPDGAYTANAWFIHGGMPWEPFPRDSVRVELGTVTLSR
jgi:hypothetical protein